MSGNPGPAVLAQLSEWTVVGMKQDFDRDNRLRYMRSQGKWKVAIITTPVKEAIDKKGSSGKDIEKCGKRIELGMFATKAEAELVHDLRILKLEGVTCNGELNLGITLFCPKLARLVSIKDTTDVTSVNTQESVKIEIKQQLNFLNIDEATKKEVEKRIEYMGEPLMRAVKEKGIIDGKPYYLHQSFDWRVTKLWQNDPEAVRYWMNNKHNTNYPTDFTSKTY